MRHGRLAGWLLCSAVLLGTGCQAFYSYRPVSVLVRDAETKQPLAGAEVRITYPMTRPSVAPWDSVEQAGDDGIAHLRAAPSGESGLRVAADAGDHLSEMINVPVEAIEEIPPAPLLWKDGPRPVTYVLDLYAVPPPSVELVLPKDFRGLVKAVIEVQETPGPPGQRCFSYNVPPSGFVKVSGPPLLRRVSTPDFRARFADGTPLPREAHLLDVAFRPLKAEIDIQYFVVGNQSLFDIVRRQVEEETAKRTRLREVAPSSGRPRRHSKATME